MRITSALLLIVLANATLLNAQTFKKGVVTDIDGNTYQTVVIGEYEWMAENLRVTKYNNSAEISNITDNNVWINLKSGAYCWYENIKNNAEKFGALYNWYAVNTGNLCPDGWRVPSDEEWKYLEGYTDTKYGVNDTIWNLVKSRGYDVAQHLKATNSWGTNCNGSNDVGFSAFPCGERTSKGKFLLIGQNGFWWSRTTYDSSRAWYRSMIYLTEKTLRDTHPKIMGFSVRCLKDK